MADQSQQGNQAERVQQAGAAAEGERAPRHPRPNAGGDGQRPPRQGQRNRNRNQGNQPVRRETEGGYFRDSDGQSSKPSNNQAMGQENRQANQSRSRNRSQNRQDQGPNADQGQSSSGQSQQGQARRPQGQGRPVLNDGTGQPRKRNSNRNRNQNQGPREGLPAEPLAGVNEEKRIPTEDNHKAAKPRVGEPDQVNQTDKRIERQDKPGADTGARRRPEEASAPLRDNQREPKRESSVRANGDQNRSDDRERSSKQNQLRNKQKMQLSQKMAPKRKVSILDHQLQLEEKPEDIRLDNLVIEKEIELVIAEIKAVSLGFD